jgi:hypothetical protein
LWRRCRRRGPSVVSVVGDDNDEDAKPRHDVDAILNIAVVVRPFPRSNAALGRNMMILQLSLTFGVRRPVNNEPVSFCGSFCRGARAVVVGRKRDRGPVRPTNCLPAEKKAGSGRATKAHLFVLWGFY